MVQEIHSIPPAAPPWHCFSKIMRSGGTCNRPEYQRRNVRLVFNTSRSRSDSFIILAHINYMAWASIIHSPFSSPHQACVPNTQKKGKNSKSVIPGWSWVLIYGTPLLFSQPSIAPTTSSVHCCPTFLSWFHSFRFYGHEEVRFFGMRGVWWQKEM